MYGISLCVDKKLQLRACNAPHMNGDCFISDPRSDCSMCSLLGVRLLLATAASRNRCLTKIGVKAAFLQIVAAERDVYVIPPHDSADHGTLL